MSKGLGKIERRILEVLKWQRKKDKEFYRVHPQYKPHYDHDITMTMYQVFYGDNYWRKIENSYDEYDKEFTEKYGYHDFELTASQKQRVWRAVRSLERKGYVTTEKKYAGRNTLFSHGGRKYYKTINLNV